MNDFIEALKNSDKVKIILTGVGEKEFNTEEVYNYIKNTKEKAMFYKTRNASLQENIQLLEEYLEDNKIYFYAEKGEIAEKQKRKIFDEHDKVEKIMIELITKNHMEFGRREERLSGYRDGLRFAIDRLEKKD